MTTSSAFIKKFSIYAVGNIGSKLIMFLLYPVMTFYLSPDELGAFDLYFTIIIWAGVAMMLNLRDGIFRFVMSGESIVFNTIIHLFLRICLCNAVLLFSIAAICYFFNINLAFNPFLLAAFFLSFNFYEVYQQIIRASGKTKLYVTGNLVASISVALITIVLLRTTELKANSLIIAYIISKLLAFVITEKIYPVLKDGFKTFEKHDYNRNIANKILGYSLFLLPACMAVNGIENWSRLYIYHYLGEYYNGIYAVITKFSSIFFVITAIYQQTWQESAIRDYKKVEKNVYFSLFFNYYLLFLSVAAMGFAIGMEMFYPVLMADAYYESVRYIFPQIISMIFMALSFFLGLGYECSYQVKRSMYSAVLASLVSLILNYFFITRMGLMGCIVANICAGSSMFLYRFIDVRRYFIIRLNKFGFTGIAIILLTVTMWFIYYYGT